MTAISISMAGWVVERVGDTEYHTYAQGDDRVVVVHTTGSPTATLSELYARNPDTVGRMLALLGLARARSLAKEKGSSNPQIGIRMPIDDEDRTYAEGFWSKITGRRPHYDEQAIYLRGFDIDAILKRHKTGAAKHGSR